MKNQFRYICFLVLSVFVFSYVVYWEQANRRVVRKVSQDNLRVLAFAEVQRMFEDLGGKVGEHPVIVFSATWCTVCGALEKELNKRNVRYLRADVDKNRQAYRYFKTITGGGPAAVPLTVVGSRVIAGMRVQQILDEIEGLSQLGRSI